MTVRPGRAAMVLAAATIALTGLGVGTATAASGPAPARHAPVRLIIDTDIFADVDDVGALAIANAAQDNGNVDLLGVMVDTPSRWGAPAVDAIDTYYGHGDIPVGTLKPNDDSIFPDHNYAQDLAQNYPNSIRDGYRAPDAVALYRKILARQPDHSVTIAAIGLETNLANLLNSPPDQSSPLSGQALVARKVAALSVMGGQYPSGKEFNFDQNPAATQRVVGGWPTPVVFDGFEIGATVYTGAALFTKTPPGNPVRTAYQIYVGAGNNRNSWDPSNVFHAIFGTANLFTLSAPGVNQVAADGSNTWIPTPGANQRYLVKTASDSAIADALTALMVQPPRHRHPAG